MRISIDIQSAVTQRAGVGRYTRELVRHLGEIAPDDRFCLTYFDFKGNAAPIDAPNAEQNAVRWFPGRIAQLAWKTLRWPPYDRLAGPADLYHFPNFVIPPLRQGKSVVTIHDMSFIACPQFSEERNVRYLNTHIRDTAERADAIITVSQFSADEICSTLDVDPARVFPIHLGIADSFARPDEDTKTRILTKYGLDRPFILAVGTIEPRKNLPLLVDIFERLSDFDGYLVIAGGHGWKVDPILERINRSPRAASIRCLGYTSDDVLPALYAGASALVQTSFYEGFGLPPVEAMACGTPVVSSTGGSLPEVLGDGAVLVDSFEPDAWMEPIRRVLEDSTLRDTLGERARRKAATYRWADTATKTMNVYRQVAS
jgi:glycosyltransferase involved in cell wall biosynthesis